MARLREILPVAIGLAHLEAAAGLTHPIWVLVVFVVAPNSLKQGSLFCLFCGDGEQYL